MIQTKNEEPSPRIAAHLPVEFRRSYARSQARGVIKNISASGVFLANSEKGIEKEEKIIIALNVLGRVRKVFAKVVWQNEFGTGLKFLPNNRRDSQIVDDLMYDIETKRKGNKLLLDEILNGI